MNDWVYLKISPMKSVMQFGKKGKLSSYYIAYIKFLEVLVKYLMSWIVL